MEDHQALMKFNDIYMNSIRNPQSGANEVDVLSKFHKIYKAKDGKPFGNEAFWGVVNDKPKWLNLKSVDDYVGMSKRSKTSESAHIQSSDARIGRIEIK
ncbi:unnamed protein product [Lactuca saligna]|uniref:Uncharacterized protein n=1 Tax=Lactuca saligna TaxID=75948 RepID=A0AA35Z8Q1_LACSI|nr:unnamed protein product [Lactuca saligna]